MRSATRTFEFCMLETMTDVGMLRFLAESHAHVASCNCLNGVRRCLEAMPESVFAKCTTCGKQGPSVMRCSKCFLAFYCDATCQNQDWAAHKPACIKISRSERQKGIMWPSLKGAA
jgi:hypothetical protein